MDLRRSIVAAFVVLHAASMILSSLPSLPAEALRGERSEEVEATIATARERFGPGVEPPLREGVRAWAGLTRGLHAVFGPYARYTGTQQGWTMFGWVPREAEQLEIWVRRGSAWEPLYVARSPEANWRRAFFDNERVRTFVHNAADGKASRWRSFADWVAREVRADDPTVVQVKVQLVKVTIPPHEELARTGTLALGKPFRVELRPPKAGPR
jgi:hypothetical protein